MPNLVNQRHSRQGNPPVAHGRARSSSIHPHALDRDQHRANQSAVPEEAEVLGKLGFRVAPDGEKKLLQATLLDGCAPLLSCAVTAQNHTDRAEENQHVQPIRKIFNVKEVKLQLFAYII